MKTIEIVYYTNGTPQYVRSSEYKELPETWEELCELCEQKEIYISKKRDYIVVGTEIIGYDFMFNNDGTVFFNTDVCVKEKVSPERMWQIIKSLVEER